jgi:hypothetical protein
MDNRFDTIYSIIENLREEVTLLEKEVIFSTKVDTVGTVEIISTVSGAGSAISDTAGDTDTTAYVSGIGSSITNTAVAVPVYARNSYRVWPNHIEKGGVTALNFNSSIKLRWKNDNGDWLDKNGTEQGTVPWYTFKVPALSVGYIEVDITDLAKRWHVGENRGAFFIAPNSNTDGSSVRWCGTFGVNPPQLLVTLTDGSSVSLLGDLCSFTENYSASAVPQSIDCGMQAPMSEAYRQVIHFNELSSLTGNISSAVMRLYADSADDKFALNIEVYETDAPPLLLGGAGLPPTYGLSKEVGELNLSGHPSVIIAGDFREENWNNTPGVRRDGVIAKLTKPAKMFNYAAMRAVQYDKSQVIEDPDCPGRYYLRTCIAKGQVGGGEFKYVWHRSGPAETGYMPDPAGYEPEVYTRCEIFLEQDSFWSTDYAFKFSPVGLDMRYGKGTPDGGWDGDSIWIYGSGQTSSDGSRHWNATLNQWILEGHSIRGHLLGQPHPTLTAYPGVVALGIAPSHLGPYDYLHDGGKYGTEQNLRIGTKGRDHCIPMGRWVTIESRCKVNTIDMSVLDADGNGVARNDGIWEMWLDGVFVGGRYNLAWFRHPSMGIRGNWLMAYHGGNTPTQHDIYWRIRNFCMARQYIGPAVY